MVSVFIQIMTTITLLIQLVKSRATPNLRQDAKENSFVFKAYLAEVGMTSSQAPAPRPCRDLNRAASLSDCACIIISVALSLAIFVDNQCCKFLDMRQSHQETVVLHLRGLTWVQTDRETDRHCFTV